jgi:hypothetical protein
MFRLLMMAESRSISTRSVPMPSVTDGDRTVHNNWPKGLRPSQTVVRFVVVSRIDGVRTP